MQGFQSHIHIQLCQNVNVAEEPECDEVTNKQINPMQPEEEHELKHLLKCNADQIALLDAGSTFNSMNNEEPLINFMEAVQPIVSRTNVGQPEMKKCSKTPELTEEMWLDDKSVITTMSFAKLAEHYCIQCNNQNGEPFQVHAKVGMMKFGKSKEGSCHHEFSPEFIKGPQKNKT